MKIERTVFTFTNSEVFHNFVSYLTKADFVVTLTHLRDPSSSAEGSMSSTLLVMFSFALCHPLIKIKNPPAE